MVGSEDGGSNSEGSASMDEGSVASSSRSFSVFAGGAAGVGAPAASGGMVGSPRNSEMGSSTCSTTASSPRAPGAQRTRIFAGPTTNATTPSATANTDLHSQHTAPKPPSQKKHHHPQKKKEADRRGDYYFNGLKALDIGFTELHPVARAVVLRALPAACLEGLNIEGLQWTPTEAIELYKRAQENRTLLSLAVAFNASCSARSYRDKIAAVMARNAKLKTDRERRLRELQTAAASALAESAAEHRRRLSAGSVTGLGASSSSAGGGGSGRLPVPLAAAIRRGFARVPGAHSLGGPGGGASLFLHGSSALPPGYTDYASNDTRVPEWLAPEIPPEEEALL